MRRSVIEAYKRKQGFVLLTVLLLSLFISLLVNFIRENQSVETQLQAHYQEKLIAFTQAETALYVAKKWIDKQSNKPITQTKCLTYPCVIEFYPNQHWSWKESGNESEYSTSIVGQGVIVPLYIVRPALFIIEHFDFIEDADSTEDEIQRGTDYYRLTAFGFGSHTTSLAHLQMMISKRYDPAGFETYASKVVSWYQIN